MEADKQENYDISDIAIAFKAIKILHTSKYAYKSQVDIAIRSVAGRELSDDNVNRISWIIYGVAKGLT